MTQAGPVRAPPWDSSPCNRLEERLCFYLESQAGTVKAGSLSPFTASHRVMLCGVISLETADMTEVSTRKSKYEKRRENRSLMT